MTELEQLLERKKKADALGEEVKTQYWYEYYKMCADIAHGNQFLKLS